MDRVLRISERQWLECCWSSTFAEQMVAAGPFSNYEEAASVASDIWLNKVDMKEWLKVISAHPATRKSPSKTIDKPTTSQCSKKGEQSALATTTDTTLQALKNWSALYVKKFGFEFIVCDYGRSTPDEIVAKIKARYMNRPYVELEVAVKEQLEITKFHIFELFAATTVEEPVVVLPPVPWLKVFAHFDKDTLRVWSDAFPTCAALRSIDRYKTLEKALPLLEELLTFLQNNRLAGLPGARETLTQAFVRLTKTPGLVASLATQQARLVSANNIITNWGSTKNIAGDYTIGDVENAIRDFRFNLLPEVVMENAGRSV